MAKRCKYCGKELVLPSVVYMHLDTYNVGGTDIVASDCCGGAYEVTMNVSYKVEQYKGSRTSDEWGAEFKHKLKK